TEVTVRVWTTADMLSAQIEDRGGGFDAEDALARPRSGGLAGMQERVALLGGRLTIESRLGAGTQILAELPCLKREDNHDRCDCPGGRPSRGASLDARPPGIRIGLLGRE